MPTAHRVLPVSSAAVLATLLWGVSPGAAQQLGQPTHGPGYQAAPQQQQPAVVAPPAQQGVYQPQAGPGVTPTTAPGLAPPQPQPPFVLNDVEQQFVQQVLTMWEQESTKINTYTAQFTRLDYNNVFNPGSEAPMVVKSGQISYSRPDKGSFKVEEIKRWKPADPQNTAPDAPGEWQVQKQEVGDHWVCDGKAIYEYDHVHKQLKVMPLPENLRGEQIVNGPLPFLFGARAEQMSQRYWIRARQSDASQIWLEAYPRWQADAANYHHCDVMLDRKTMQPKALQVHMPTGNERHVYTFEDPTINGRMDALFGGLFNAPRTPLGWTRVIVDDATGEPVQAAAPTGTQRQ